MSPISLRAGIDLNVLHLQSGELTGGAARGTYWLHSALREIGVDSHLMISGRDAQGDDSVTPLADSQAKRVAFALRNRIGNLPTHLYRNRQQRIFNTGLAGIDFTRTSAYRAADIIHLHWINGLVAMRSLRRIEKPIVWTLRDMWPLTGGCHYAIDCDRYGVGCGHCPQLASKRPRDLSRVVVKAKNATIPSGLQVVGISEWLSDCARRSEVFRRHQTRTISNNIDTRLFSPLPTQVARQALNLPVDKKVVLVGAQRVTDFYKGFDRFLEALSQSNSRSMHIVTFGRSAEAATQEVDLPKTHLGFLSDAVSLRLAYSAADVFVAPSLMDAFGKTLAESMACGTPVVCFDATGPKDIVAHKETGYRARPYEPGDLAAGIDWVLSQDTQGGERLRQQSRQRAVEHFDSRVIARQYKTLYQEMLGSTVRGES